MLSGERSFLIYISTSIYLCILLALSSERVIVVKCGMLLLRMLFLLVSSELVSHWKPTRSDESFPSLNTPHPYAKHSGKVERYLVG